MKLGFYKICFKLKDNWVESGVSISTHEAVSSLSINGIIEVGATVAKRAGKFFAPLLPTSLNVSTLSNAFACPARVDISVSFSWILNRKHDIIMQELRLHRKVWTTCFGKSRGRFLCVFSLVLFGLYSVRSLTLCFGVNRYRLFLREVIAIQPLIILKPDLKSSRRMAQEFLAT
jgi:hypothetical protein